MIDAMQVALAPDGPLVARLRARLPHALAIYAFGSQVNGHATSSSDLDLAVLVAGCADPLVLWELAGELADLAACPVDLRDLRAATTVLQYQVITTGERMGQAHVGGVTRGRGQAHTL